MAKVPLEDFLDLAGGLGMNEEVSWEMHAFRQWLGLLRFLQQQGFSAKNKGC